MKIAKALKVKNRLAGEVRRLEEIVLRENSRKASEFNKNKVASKLEDLTDVRVELIQLKALIQRKTAPIADKLIRLAELKGEIEFFQSLETKEGTFAENHYANPVREVEFKTYYNRDAIDDIVVDLQNQIAELQDEVDEYNATTDIYS